MTTIQPDIVNLMGHSATEQTFHTSGHVNRHKDSSVIRQHERDSPKLNVSCSVTNWTLLFFDAPTVTSDVYLQTVQQYAIDDLPLQIRLAGYFQQDGAPPHFALTVRVYLDHT